MPQTIFSKKELVEGPAPRRRQEVVHSCRPAPPRQSARRVAAALGSPSLGAPDGHGVHGPQLLHVAVLRVEAPRRVRRCSESAHVLHCLDAAVRQVLVALEPVGVVLEDPELCGRLLLHVFRGAMHRLVGPRVVGRSGLLKVVAPRPPLRATRVARSFFSVWIRRSTTAVALRSSGRFVRFRGQLRSSVANSLPRSVVTTKVVPRQLLRGTLGGPADRLGVLVLQRFHGSLPGEDVHHHQAVLRLPPRVLAEVDEVGLQPVVRPLSGRLAQRTRPWRLHLPAHVGLQRLEGHGLRHVKVALPHKSVQLPWVPHVEVARLQVRPAGPGSSCTPPTARW